MKTSFKIAIVWLLRVILGATFVFSGFTKAIDPWGFMYKIQEYLIVWGLDWVSRESILAGGALMSIIEFTCGVLMMLGCWRRLTSRVIFAIMCVMLPLTAYIAIVSPVEDCGCFGDALVLSNNMTFVKNIVLMAIAIYLVKYNNQVRGLYFAASQWVVVFSSLLYALILVLVGYVFQPMVDFRPYPIGSSITDDIGESNLSIIYEKDGVERSFSIDALPDSTWNFVRREEGHELSNKLLAVYDGNEDVTPYVFEDEGEQMILIVTNPDAHKRARADMANRINDFMSERGGSMIALVALSPERLEKWKSYSNPEYDVYSAEDTSLKELARGDAALVYLSDGVIQWKRNLYFLPGDFPDTEINQNPLDDVFIPDAGEPIWKISGIYLIIIMLPLLWRLYCILTKRGEREDDEVEEETTNK